MAASSLSNANFENKYTKTWQHKPEHAPQPSGAKSASSNACRILWYQLSLLIFALASDMGKPCIAKGCFLPCSSNKQALKSQASINANGGDIIQKLLERVDGQNADATPSALTPV